MKILTGNFGVRRGQNQVPAPRVLQTQGPVIEVQVETPNLLAQYLKNKGKTVPGPTKGMALIDSGATISCVDSDVIRRLGVKPIGVTTVLTAGGPKRQNCYPARFSFPQQKMYFEFSRVMGADLKGQSIMGKDLVALLGRDVLSRCLFIYNGPNATFTLAL